MNKFLTKLADIETTERRATVCQSSYFPGAFIVVYDNLTAMWRDNIFDYDHIGLSQKERHIVDCKLKSLSIKVKNQHLFTMKGVI